MGQPHGDKPLKSRRTGNLTVHEGSSVSCKKLAASHSHVEILSLNPSASAGAGVDAAAALTVTLYTETTMLAAIRRTGTCAHHHQEN